MMNQNTCYVRSKAVTVASGESRMRIAQELKLFDIDCECSFDVKSPRGKALIS